MSACDAELCPNWAGFGCVCDALALDRPTVESDDCADCGHVRDDHNAPDHGGACFVCGIDCEGWS